MAQNKKHIQVYNLFTNEESEYHLTFKEFYLYCYLKKEKYLNEDVKTSIALINDFLPLKFNNKKDRNFRDIKETLIGLQNKSAISISNQDGEIIVNPKGNQSLLIYFTEYKKEGFHQLAHLDFNTASDMTSLYIYVTVAKWKDTFNCTYDRWASILMCSRNTAISKVGKAIENKSIYCNTGDFIEAKKQAVNQYKISPFKNEEKTLVTKKKEIKIATDRLHEKLVVSDDYLSKLIAISKIFNTYKDEFGMDVFPIVENYIFYMEVKKKTENKELDSFENSFLTTANKRLGAMQYNKQFKKDWDLATSLFNAKNKEVSNKLIGKASVHDYLGGKSVDEAFGYQ